MRAGKSRLGFVQPMIRRDLLEAHGLRFPTQIRAGEDFVHYFECVAHGARFALVPEAWYVYRIRAGSITSEGDRFCGVVVWKKDVPDFARTL
jgi:hypothetical protein